MGTSIYAESCESLNDTVMRGVARVVRHHPRAIMLTGGPENGRTVLMHKITSSWRDIAAGLEFCPIPGSIPYRLFVWKERDYAQKVEAVYIYAPSTWTLSQAVSAAQMLGTWRAHDWLGADEV